MNKSIFKSKVFWVNAVALAAMMFPAVAEWLKQNPVAFTAVLGAVNILLRFVTSGKVTLTGDDSTPSGGAVLIALGFLAFLALPACTPEQLQAARNVPIRACVITDHGTACYSAKEGFSAEVDARSGK